MQNVISICEMFYGILKNRGQKHKIKFTILTIFFFLKNTFIYFFFHAISFILFIYLFLL